MTEKPNCTNCEHKKDLNSILLGRDPSGMFRDNRCFFGIDSSYEAVRKMDDNKIPDLRRDMYHHRWITIGFACPLEA